MKCKFCKNNLKSKILDLGEQPLCNNYIPFTEKDFTEKKYPLELYYCDNCNLVQVGHNISPEEIFSDYTYLSSYSSTWIQHAKNLVEESIKKYKLNSNSFVVEVASNDGYLLKFFKDKKIPHIGIEPATNIAEIANSNGINTLNKFFSKKTAEQLLKDESKANLIIANNVLAHVPDINDFLEGINIILREDGYFLVEVPYLLRLIENNQFDTIYHEHFFYYSITSLNTILNAHNLKIVDIAELNTHGGSLRVTIKYDNGQDSPILEKYLEEEEKIGLNTIENFELFSKRINNLKNNFMSKFHKIKEDNRLIAAYGAPGKGNTLLNFYKMDSSFINFTVDKNPIKQNTFLPGSRIPVYSPSKIKDEKPDYIIILPWNLKEEIISNLEFTKEWGAKFIIPIPNFSIV